jgi:hypothetical protein
MRIAAGMLAVVVAASPSFAQDRRYAPYPRQEECPQGRQIRAQKAYPSTMSDCQVLDADTAAENQKLNGNAAPRIRPPPNQPRIEPKIDVAKQRVDEDLKLGYPSLSFEDFALDNKTMISNEKRIAIEGFYHKVGNIDELYASQVETIPSVSAPTSHIIPLLIDDAPRDIRAYFLRCSEQSPNVGCWTRVRGTVTMCSLTMFGSSVPKPCINVDGGWFSKN